MDDDDPNLTVANLPLARAKPCSRCRSLYLSANGSFLARAEVNSVTLDNLVGTGLAQRIQEEVSGGYLSVQTLDALTKVRKDVQAMAAALDSAKNGISALGLHDEQLTPGTSVVGMSIPPEQIDDVEVLEKEIEFF